MTKLEEWVATLLTVGFHRECEWGFYEPQTREETEAYKAAFHVMEVVEDLCNDRVLVTVKWPSGLPWDKTSLWNGEHGLFDLGNDTISVIVAEDEIPSIAALTFPSKAPDCACPVCQAFRAAAPHMLPA